MKYNFDEYIERSGTGSIKRSSTPDCGAMSGDVAQMWVADMDFACPPAVIRAVEQAAANRIFGYTSLSCLPGYFRAVCDYYRRHFDWYINSEHIILSPGVVPALKMLVRNLTKKGDGVIIQRPVYPPFTAAVTENQRRVINNPLIYDGKGNYTVDFEDLERCAAQKNNTMMILCSPHNPVGRDWTAEELTRIYDICHRNGVLLVADEIHCDLVRSDVKHTVLASLFPLAEDIITCTAPSKTFNIAGLKCSNIIVRSGEHRKALALETSNGIDPITANAAIAAFDDCDQWLEEVREYIDGNFAYLKSALSAALPKAVLSVPQATYLAWIDLSAYTTDTEGLVERMLKYEGVRIQPGDNFGKEGKGFVRCNLALPSKHIKHLVDGLANQLDRLKDGDKLIPFTLGCPWRGSESVADNGKRKLIVFLPNVGSTFSQIYIARLTAAHKHCLANGIEIFAVTQSSVSALESRLNPSAVPYPLLSDGEGRVFEAYKIKEAPCERYLVTPEDNSVLELIRASGISDEAVGDKSLKKPAAFVTNTFNRIVLAHYAETAGTLPDPMDILKSVGMA